MKKVAGTLKLVYSQYRELQGFAQFGSDLDADTKARLAQGERIVEILKQDRNSPVPVEKQVAILYATSPRLSEGYCRGRHRCLRAARLYRYLGRQCRRQRRDGEPSVPPAT